MNSPRASAIPGGKAKLIYCVVPDDGTDKRLFQVLHGRHGIDRANSVYCRGIAVLQDAKTRGNKLPEPYLARFITIIVEEDQADELFDLIHAEARIGRPGGGMIAMAPAAFATPFLLPAGLPEESGQELQA